MPLSIPWLPVMAGALTYFILGAVWYAYFGNAWLKELHKRKEQLHGGDPTPYMVAALGCVLNAIAVAIVLNWVAPLCETAVLAGLVTALLLGGAVFAAGAAKHYAFAGWSWKLYAIDLGHDMTGFFLMSMIIALLR